MLFEGQKVPFLVPNSDSVVYFVVADAVSHQGSVIAFGSTLYGSRIEIVGALAFCAAYHLAVVAVPIQGIVGAFILMNAVWALAIPSEISVVAVDSAIAVASDDDAIVGSQLVIIDVSFYSCCHGYVFRLVLAIVESGIYMPGSILVFGGDDGEVACGCQCSF